MGIISPVATDTNGNPKATGSQQQLGRDEFLQLLIAKLQYQDPMKPMDDEDFIAQLAQFSSLEQMNNISDGIAEANEWDFLQMQSINNTMAAGLIGREITATYNGVYVDGEHTPKINYSTSEFASSVTFTITNAEGEIVATKTVNDIPAGSNSFEWDGKDNYGNTVPHGDYKIAASAESASGNPFSPSLSLVGVVESIKYRDGGAFLVVNGTEIALGNISKISQAGL